MARRTKAETTEQWASEAERIAAMPDRWAEPVAEVMVDARILDSGARVGLNDSLFHATLDSIIARMQAVPAMTDAAARAALAEAVADLARLMR